MRPTAIPPAPPRDPRRQAGFTLIELLVALGIMAVVSLLGWRGLDTVLRSRDRIVEHSEAMRALSTAFAQLEEDVRRSWPVRLRLPGVQTIGFRAQDDGSFALELIRESPAGGGAGLQRIAWRVRQGRLERGFAAWQPDPGEADGRADPTGFGWQSLATGVTGLGMRGFVAGQGWLLAEALPMRGVLPATAAPVTGVEVTLERRDGERILRIFTVKD